MLQRQENGLWFGCPLKWSSLILPLIPLPHEPPRKKHVHPPCFTTGTISWCVYLAKEWCSIQTGHSHLDASFDPPAMEAPMEVPMESNSRVRFCKKQDLENVQQFFTPNRYLGMFDVQQISQIHWGLETPKPWEITSKAPGMHSEDFDGAPEIFRSRGRWVPLEIVILWDLRVQYRHILNAVVPQMFAD